MARLDKASFPHSAALIPASAPGRRAPVPLAAAPRPEQLVLDHGRDQLLTPFGLAMLPDTGERYLSTLLFEGIHDGSDDEWLGGL